MKKTLTKRLVEALIIFILQIVLWLIINDFELNFRYVVISFVISVIVIFALPRRGIKEKKD